MKRRDMENEKGTTKEKLRTRRGGLCCQGDDTALKL